MPPPARGYPGGMTRTLSVVALVILVPFLVYSFWVVGEHGYFGFLELAGREPWALQILLDLVLACLIYSVWLVPDARARGIAPWPYLALTLVAGSVGGLAYLVHRGLRPARAAV